MGTTLSTSQDEMVMQPVIMLRMHTWPFIRVNTPKTEQGVLGNGSSPLSDVVHTETMMLQLHSIWARGSLFRTAIWWPTFAVGWWAIVQDRCHFSSYLAFILKKNCCEKWSLVSIAHVLEAPGGDNAMVYTYMHVVRPRTYALHHISPSFNDSSNNRFRLSHCPLSIQENQSTA